jgi:hypothetical protein
MKRSYYLTIFLLLTCFTNPVYSFERVERAIPIEVYQRVNNNKNEHLKKFNKHRIEKSNQNKKFVFTKNNDENNKLSNTFLYISTTLSLLSIIAAFFSIILWVVLILFALLFLILGFATRNKNVKQIESQKGSYKDVIYLKNGSVVKGIIIEQIPNVSLKIESSDGSIFVYKMEEVEKIGKEKSK